MPPASPARRTVVTGTLATGLAAATPLTLAAAPACAQTTTSFRHGVASGDPLPDAVVLWTRVTPSPDATPGSGRGADVRVDWEVASDPDFRRVVRRGRIVTGPDRDHTVKVDATGLQPATSYWYRFRSAGVLSQVGRTRTAPEPTASPRQLRIGVVSCSNWEAGYFAAYRHLADTPDLDLVLHVGDYLYEYPAGEYGTRGVAVRATEPAHEIVALADYRVRHGQYKADPDLQRLHAAVPWVTTWDDHESANDAWSAGAENHDPQTEGGWAARAAAARQAYDEWMPIRLSGTAEVGDGHQLYRSLTFGRLADLRLLDLRSYRSEQVGYDELGRVGDRARTITGRAQMEWFKDSLATSDATWKLVGNPVMISPVNFLAVDAEIGQALHDMTGILPPDGIPYNPDQWDGYTAERREVIDFLGDRGITNTVFLTGDIHSAWACELPDNAGLYPLSRSVGVELVATSVTSDNLDDILRVMPRTLSTVAEAAIIANNRHIRYLDFDRHGYSVLTLTPGKAHMDWYVLTDKTSRTSTARWSVGWSTTAGTHRLHREWGPSA